jgi:hypothetical protein
MPPFIFSYPNTGFRVQGFVPDDDGSEGGDDVLLALHAQPADQRTPSIRRQARRPAKVENNGNLHAMLNGAGSG